MIEVDHYKLCVEEAQEALFQLSACLPELRNTSDIDKLKKAIRAVQLALPCEIQQLEN